MNKRLLFIFTRYHLSKNSPYLTNELVDEFDARGCSSTVIAYDWGSERSVKIRLLKNRKEVLIGLSSRVKYIKYFTLWSRLFLAVFKELMKGTRYDSIIMDAPLTTLFPAIILLPFFRGAKKKVIVFDTFPIHQIQAGAIPSWLGAILRLLEGCSIKLFDTIGVMGVNNKKVISSYYQVPIDKVVLTGIWGVADDIHEKSVPKALGKDIKMVFGGQLTSGRRLDLLIDFLSELRKAVAKEKNIVVDIFSSGHVCNQYKEKYSQYDWINFCQPLDRETYVRNLHNYDFGLIVTDENVSLPTLPSKIIDYINASISVIAMVESECELRGSIYESEKIHLLPFSYTNADIQYLENRIISLDRSKLYAQPLRSLFSVKRTVDVLIK
ncbi:MAG: hypothetical protein COA61_010485 [Zetaproteobacteria bacterium]|nr:hypothetical protein [Zetaproteobacteria bacterium]